MYSCIQLQIWRMVAMCVIWEQLLAGAVYSCTHSLSHYAQYGFGLAIGTIVREGENGKER